MYINLKQWIERNLFRNINRKYAVIRDSDKENEADPIKPHIRRWKRNVEADGGLFLFLKKRTIENYLHPDVINREHGTAISYGDFDKVKDFRKDPHNIPFGIDIIQKHTVEEILEQDKYDDGGSDKNELVEIISKILSLVES